VLLQSRRKRRKEGKVSRKRPEGKKHKRSEQYKE
jgi:hypothetical protein